jgi:hypothetical protein
MGLAFAESGKNICLIWQLSSKLQNKANPGPRSQQFLVEEEKAMGFEENEFFRDFAP